MPRSTPAPQWSTISITAASNTVRRSSHPGTGLLDRHSHEPRPRASVLEYPNSLSPQVSSSAPQEPRNPPFPPADAWPGDPTSRLPGTMPEDNGRLSSLHRFLCAWCQACDFEPCNLQDIREALGTAGLRTPSTPPAFITSFSVWHWECREIADQLRSRASAQRPRHAEFQL